MAAATISTFVEGLFQSQLLDAEQQDEVLRLQETMQNARELAQDLLRREWLTAYQINQIFQGKGQELILGPYLLLLRIGEGGMGQVFKARQKMLNRVVALKVIRKECLSNPKVILRFQREIRAAGQLSHPHIVRAYDADQVNGTYYIAMEFIDGVDLAKLVVDQGPLPVDQACEYIRQAALGLQHAFERGLVHRDIKPANLLVTRAVSSDRRRSSGMILRPVNLDERRKNVPPRPEAAQQYPWGIVKILDMGLARCTEATGHASTQLTHVGSVMGTPEFIAPEQARDSHTSDVRADIYSLGCTLYFLLTGLPPFPDGSLTEKLLQHQFEIAEPVAQVRRQTLLALRGKDGCAGIHKAMLPVPRRVEELLAKLLAKSPDDRFQTPIELANELQTIVQQLGDGSLLKAEEAALPTNPPAKSKGGLKAAPDDATVLIQPFLPLTPTPGFRGAFAKNLAIVLATALGFGAILAATMLAGLMGRGHFIKAGGAPEEPNPPLRKTADPVSKRTN